MLNLCFILPPNDQKYPDQRLCILRRERSTRHSPPSTWPWAAVSRDWCLCFFLGITHVRRTISYLAREERVSCVDRMLLPAIRQVCPPHVIQHHPQSFDDVESKTYSGLQESYSGMVRSGRDALHHIPLEYLEEIWVEIARHVEHADLVQFRGMFTVLVA